MRCEIKKTEAIKIVGSEPELDRLRRNSPENSLGMTPNGVIVTTFRSDNSTRYALLGEEDDIQAVFEDIGRGKEVGLTELFAGAIGTPAYLDPNR